MKIKSEKRAWVIIPEKGTLDIRQVWKLDGIVTEYVLTFRWATWDEVDGLRRRQHRVGRYERLTDAMNKLNEIVQLNA